MFSGSAWATCRKCWQGSPVRPVCASSPFPLSLLPYDTVGSYLWDLVKVNWILLCGCGPTGWWWRREVTCFDQVVQFQDSPKAVWALIFGARTILPLVGCNWLLPGCVSLSTGHCVATSALQSVWATQITCCSPLTLLWHIYILGTGTGTGSALPGRMRSAASTWLWCGPYSLCMSLLLEVIQEMQC